MTAPAAISATETDISHRNGVPDFRNITDWMRHAAPDCRSVPPVSFGQPDGSVASVTLHGRPAGEIRHHSGTIWTYEHGDASFVGTHTEVRRAIQRHYRNA